MVDRVHHADLTITGVLLARRTFQEKPNNDIIPQARERQMISQVDVVGTGVLDAHRDSGSVYNRSPLKVAYERVDGKWLINYIKVI
jgi:Mce-associated membrane protein